MQWKPDTCGALASHDRTRTDDVCVLNFSGGGNTRALFTGASQVCSVHRDFRGLALFDAVLADNVTKNQAASVVAAALGARARQTDADGKLLHPVRWRFDNIGKIRLSVPTLSISTSERTTIESDFATRDSRLILE